MEILYLCGAFADDVKEDNTQYHNLFIFMKKVSLLMLSLIVCLTMGAQQTKMDGRYWLGADISTANGMSARGATLLHFEGEKEYELTELMKVMGLDAVRYRESWTWMGTTIRWRPPCWYV